MTGGNTTDKKVYEEVSKRANGRCEVCGKFGDLQLHHILRRRVKETPDNCIMLCYECHEGTNGVHGMYGHPLDLKLKKKVQDNYFSLGFKEDKVRQLNGSDSYFEKFTFIIMSVR